ncbi:MAG TPA: hypothetical protein VH855_15890 [Acetobacteraceae bacterium]|jgi:hypothetical protein
MRGMLFVVGAVMTLSAFGVAYAGEGEGSVPNTRFTQFPGVMAQPPTQTVLPAAAAANAPATQAYVTRSYQGTWLFRANETGGGPNG